MVQRVQASLECASDGIDAAGQAALHHHERQFNVAVLFRFGFFAPRTNVLGDGVVEVEFFRRQLVAGRFGVARLEEWLSVPVHHLFLQTTQEKSVAGVADGGFAFKGFGLHRITGDRFVNAFRDKFILLEQVVVEQHEQTAKGVFASTMGRGGQEQQVVGARRKRLDSLVAVASFDFGAILERRELVRLVHHNHVPLGLFGGVEAALVARDKVNRGDEQPFVLARKLPWLGLERGAVDQVKL